MTLKIKSVKNVTFSTNLFLIEYGNGTYSLEQQDDNRYLVLNEDGDCVRVLNEEELPPSEYDYDTAVYVFIYSILCGVKINGFDMKGKSFAGDYDTVPISITKQKMIIEKILSDNKT